MESWQRRTHPRIDPITEPKFPLGVAETSFVMKPGNFFSELKRRNVYKVAVAYAVVSWLLIQIATQVFPFFEIPNWAVRLTVLAIVIGFPIALVIAWAFELTPEGIKRTDGIEAAKSKGPAWIYVAIIAAALSIVLFFLGRFTATNKQSTSTDISSKSIAVLPFENLSANQENAFFTDGVQDEILTDLAKVADLKVISRTSVMQYKATAPRNLSEIAQALKVANVLEGSVQRSGNRVRVSAQLIDAGTDTHIWAENYDRDLSDVFSIQSEIAQTITDQLRAKLSPKEKAAIETKPTTDLVAYDLYLKADRLRLEATLNQARQRQNLVEGIQLLNEAVRRDPHFLLAHCLLAQAHDMLYFSYEQTPEQLDLAEASVNAAINLEPEAGETHLARGLHYYLGYLDYPRARQQLLLAQQLLPNNSEALGFLAYLSRRQGKWDDAIQEMKRAVELDPYGDWLEDLGEFYKNLRRYPEAAEAYDRQLALHPGSVSARLHRAVIDCDAAANLHPLQELLRATEEENPSQAAELSEISFIVALRQRNEVAAAHAVAVMSSLPRESMFFPTSFAQARVAMLRRDAAEMRANLLAAREQEERLVSSQPKNNIPLGLLALIDAYLNDKDKAIREAEAACALSPISRDALEGAIAQSRLASVYAVTGEKKQALELLSTLCQLPGGPSYGELMLDSEWDSLRDEPEFQKIVASLGPKAIK